MLKPRETTKLLEAEANRFASAFLLPADSFRLEFPKSKRLDWRSIFEMKLRWKVSARAIVRRAYDLRLMDDLQYRKANIYFQKTGQAKVEKYDATLEMEKPELVERSIDKLRRQNPRFLQRICDQLHVRPRLIRDLAPFVSWHPQDFAEPANGANIVRFARGK